MRGKAWSVEELHLLRRFWRWGFVGSEIAARLPGRTRATVLAKARRLDLPRRGSPACLMKEPPDADQG